METKICRKCKQEKELNDFYLYPNKKSHRTVCKICYNIVAKKNRDDKKENIRIYSKEYRKKNREIIKIKQKKYREDNKEFLKKRQKINSRKYYEKNSEHIKEKSKNFRMKNPDYSYNYRLNNQSYSNEYQKKRRETDFLFKLTYNVRARLNGFLKKEEIKKNNKTFEIVGCSPKFLKEHLQRQFTEGMSWDKIGKEIHIDHIIPLSSAKTEEEVYKLCHYTNLQPLWAHENLSKGNKIN